MKVPQITIDRLNAITDNKDTAQQFATLLEMAYMGKLKDDCNATALAIQVLNGETVDLTAYQRDRKPREMSQEYKDKQFAKQLAKLRKKYNQTETVETVKGGSK